MASSQPSARWGEAQKPASRYPIDGLGERQTKESGPPDGSSPEIVLLKRHIRYASRTAFSHVYTRSHGRCTKRVQRLVGYFASMGVKLKYIESKEHYK